MNTETNNSENEVLSIILYFLDLFGIKSKDMTFEN